MNDDQLRRLLRSLPRSSASAGFTGRVLRALPKEGQHEASWAFRLAAAASLVLILGIWVGVERWQTARQEEASRRAVESLRLEMEQLESELSALRRLAVESQPVLYLGGSEDVDFVLDLRQLMELEREGVLVPAALQETAPTSRKVVYQR